MTGDSARLVPPYYAVIFVSRRTSADPEGYARAAEQMLQLASQMPGYLGVDHARDADGTGITVSYWQDPDSIRQWREQADHRLVQQQGRDAWYESFQLHICRVERYSEFERPDGPSDS